MILALLWSVACGLLESLRETLPTTEDDCGPFVAGMAWAFVLFWATLTAVTLMAGRP